MICWCKRNVFFDQTIQHFLGLMHEQRFHELAEAYAGYDTTESGKMIFQKAPEQG